ncbi:MAG: hypothetical protein EOL87_11245 [Spartobacteria bacterium]|nr:hypothetical protein [Spartobacteria bacterium]
MKTNRMDETDQALVDWRAKVVRIVLIIASIVMLPLLVIVLSENSLIFSWPQRLAYACLYLVMLATALCRRCPPVWRAAVLIGIIALFAALQLLFMQLIGNGRLTLLVLPLVTMITVGSLAGWLTAGLSLLIYFSVFASLHWGFFDIGTISPTIGWLSQGLRLSASMLLLMVLFTLYDRLRIRTMLAERTARRRLDEEEADRRRLETEISRISESERHRLGAELHDGLCQQLTGTLLNCSALENMKKTTGVVDSEDIGKIRQSIEDAIGIAYDVAYGLCPLSLEPNSLIPAMERMCRTTGHLHGLECRFLPRSHVTLRSGEHAQHLYRIAGEAVANAVKHANCQKVTVELTRQGQKVTLRITDNGRGMDAVEFSRKGLGRQIMDYRANAIGGRLTINSAAGEGTTVMCEYTDKEMSDD